MTATDVATVADVALAADVVVDVAVDAATVEEDADSATEAVSSELTRQLRGWSPLIRAGLVSCRETRASVTPSLFLTSRIGVRSDAAAY
jgi:hypothetical protein